MGFLGRTVFVFASAISVTILGIIFARGAMPIINIGRDLGPGPASQIFDWLEAIVPAIIGLLLLFLAVYYVFGGILWERSQRQRRRPPR